MSAQTIYLLLALSGTSLTAVAKTQVTKGLLFPLGSPGKTPTFIYERQESRQSGNVTQIRASFRTPEGEELISERATLRYGQVTRYEYHHRQKNESGTVTVKNGHVHYRYTRGRKTKSDTEMQEPNFVIGPTIINHLQIQWKKILAGTTVKVRLGVLDRLETFGFQFSKVEEFKKKGQDFVRVKFSPTSPFVSLVVSAVYFTLEKKTARLVRSKGMTLLQVNGKDFHADSFFRPAR